MKTLILLSLTVLCCHAAEEAKLPPDAQAAIDKAEKSISTIQGKADGEILKVRQELVKALTKAQESATKKGDLNAALAIKAQIDAIPAESLLGPQPRFDPSKLKSYNTKTWDSFPGDIVKVVANESPTIATLGKDDELIALPHPDDLWASHDKGKKVNYKGDSVQLGEFMHMVMVVVQGDRIAILDTTKPITGEGPVIIKANDDNPWNNVGIMRVKVIVQKTR